MPKAHIFNQKQISGVGIVEKIFPSVTPHPPLEALCLEMKQNYSSCNLRFLLSYYCPLTKQKDLESENSSRQKRKKSKRGCRGGRVKAKRSPRKKKGFSDSGISASRSGISLLAALPTEDSLSSAKAISSPSPTPPRYENFRPLSLAYPLDILTLPSVRYEDFRPLSLRSEHSSMEVYPDHSSGSAREGHPEEVNQSTTEAQPSTASSAPSNDTATAYFLKSRSHAGALAKDARKPLAQPCGRWVLQAVTQT